MGVVSTYRTELQSSFLWLARSLASSQVLMERNLTKTICVEGVADEVESGAEVLCRR